MYSVKSWQTYQYRLFSCSSWDVLVRPLMSESKYSYSHENTSTTSYKSNRLAAHCHFFGKDKPMAETLSLVPASATGFKCPVGKY